MQPHHCKPHAADQNEKTAHIRAFFSIFISVQARKCYDRLSRVRHAEGSRWERRIGNNTVDCTCERNSRNRRMQIACSGESRFTSLIKTMISANRK